MTAFEKQLFNLKFAVKTLERSARRSTKEEGQERAKVKKAIQAQNVDTARIHAETAIRKKTESLNYLRLAARIDAVASRLQTAASMRTVTGEMESVVSALDKALASNNMERVSKIMGTFESHSDSIQVQAASLEGVLRGEAAVGTPGDQVQLLMQQVADEHGLDVGGLLLSGTPVVAYKEPVIESGLEERLAKLREF